MPAPRANFACLSKKCQQDGAATVYELPVAAIRCAVCGSKRISRLYDAVNVSSGMARKVDAVVEPAYTQAMGRKDEAAEAVKAQRVDHGFAVPIKQLAGTLAGFGMNAPLPMGAGTVMPRAASPILSQVSNRPPAPDAHSLRDREFTIKNGRPARA